VLASIELSPDGVSEPIVPAILAGDKGYRYGWIDDWLMERSIEPVIPSKKKKDHHKRLVAFNKRT